MSKVTAMVSVEEDCRTFHVLANNFQVELVTPFMKSWFCHPVFCVVTVFPEEKSKAVAFLEKTNDPFLARFVQPAVLIVGFLSDSPLSGSLSFQE